MPLPRRVRLLRAEDLLEQAAVFRAGGPVPEEQVRRQRAGVSEGKAAAEEARQGEEEGAGAEGRPGAHPPVPQFLRRGPEEGDPGHRRKEVQQDGVRTAVVQFAVLRKGL